MISGERHHQITQRSLNNTFKLIPPKHGTLSSFHGDALIDSSVTTSSILWDSCHISSNDKASLVAHYKDICCSSKFVTWAGLEGTAHSSLLSAEGWGLESSLGSFIHIAGNWHSVLAHTLALALSQNLSMSLLSTAWASLLHDGWMPVTTSSRRKEDRAKQTYISYSSAIFAHFTSQISHQIPTMFKGQDIHI